MKKKQAFEYFGEVAESYGNEYYQNYDQLGYYPANFYRLEIIKEKLKQIKPEKILDIGCGTGDPMKILIKEGFNVHGFDFSQEMVSKAKDNLSLDQIDTDRVWSDNMENITHLKFEYPCTIALGALYYASDFDTALNEMIRATEKGGDLLFSLRNSLFSMFTLNQYSLEFYLQNLIQKDLLDDSLMEESLEILIDKLANESDKKNKDFSYKNIDQLNVHNTFHNPLEIGSQIKSYGLELESIDFYHYHASLPIMEKVNPSKFYEASSKMEDSSDWRGHFMASAFVVHAKKV